MRRYLFFHGAWTALTIAAIVFFLRDVAVDPFVISTGVEFGGGPPLPIRYVPSILFRQYPAATTVATALVAIFLVSFASLVLRTVRRPPSRRPAPSEPEEVPDVPPVTHSLPPPPPREAA